MDAYNETARMRLPIRARYVRHVSAHAYAVLFASLFALLAGCHGGVDTDLLERDMRLQEDRIYELEDHLVDCQYVAQSYRKENQKLRGQLGLKQGDTPTTGSSTRAERSPAPNGPAPSVSPDTIPDEVPIVPMLEGEENGTPGVRETDLIPGGSPGDLAPPPMPIEGDPAGASTLGTEELPMPFSVEATGPLDRIVVQKLLGVARPPAPEGLLLRAVIEPRSPDGLPVRAAGDVSLMILDPQQPGPEGKIARWDYGAEDFIGRWQRSGLGSGWHFDLPLPAEIENRTYELWARFVAPDGEKYLASAEFEVNPHTVTAQSQPVPPRRQTIPSRSQPDTTHARADATEVTAATKALRWSPSPTAAALEKRKAATKHNRYRTADAPSDSGSASENLAPLWQPGPAPPPSQPAHRATRPRPEWSPYR